MSEGTAKKGRGAEVINSFSYWHAIYEASIVIHDKIPTYRANEHHLLFLQTYNPPAHTNTYENGLNLNHTEEQSIHLR